MEKPKRTDSRVLKRFLWLWKEKKGGIMGPLFVKILIAEYAVITIAFMYDGDWPRVAYFIGAIILSFGVLTMK